MSGSVYFVECLGRIKVGFSKDVTRRLADLSTSAPGRLSLIAKIEGSVGLERAIHNRLLAHRVSQEWFEDCPTVRDLIAQLIADGPCVLGYSETPSPPRQVRPSHRELIDALRELAEPRPVGDRIKAAISRAARATGLPYARAFNVWYGRARRIDAHEAQQIRDAITSKRAVSNARLAS